MCTHWNCLNEMFPISVPTSYVFVEKSFNTLHAGKFFMVFVVCCFRSKLFFSKNSFRITIRVANSLDPDQARHFVGPDLDPNCLQRTSADDTGRILFPRALIIYI